MRLAVVIGALGVLATALAPPPTARAGCASAVYVEGHLQLGQEVRGRHLPPDDGKVAAVFPVCNDGGGPEVADQHGTVTRLEGVAPTVATRDRDTVYIGQGQMTALEGHPMHTVTPKRRNCRPGPTVHRRGVAQLTYMVLGRGRRSVRIDAQTHLTSHSTTTSVVTGQRFRATTSRCGRRTVADELTFLPPLLTPDRYEPNRPDFAGLPRWVGLLLLLGLVVAIPALVTVGVVSSAHKDRGRRGAAR